MCVRHMIEMRSGRGGSPVHKLVSKVLMSRTEFRSRI